MNFPTISGIGYSDKVYVTQETYDQNKETIARYVGETQVVLKIVSQEKYAELQKRISSQSNSSDTNGYLVRQAELSPNRNIVLTKPVGSKPSKIRIHLNNPSIQSDRMIGEIIFQGIARVGLDSKCKHVYEKILFPRGDYLDKLTDLNFEKIIGVEVSGWESGTFDLDVVNPTIIEATEAHAQTLFDLDDYVLRDPKIWTSSKSGYTTSTSHSCYQMKPSSATRLSVCHPTPMRNIAATSSQSLSTETLAETDTAHACLRMRLKRYRRWGQAW